MLCVCSEIICRKINDSTRFSTYKPPWRAYSWVRFTFHEKWNFSKRLVLNLYYAALHLYGVNFTLTTAGSEQEINVYSLSIISRTSHLIISHSTRGKNSPGKLCREIFKMPAGREGRNVCGKIRAPFVPRKYNGKWALLEFFGLEND